MLNNPYNMFDYNQALKGSSSLNWYNSKKKKDFSNFGYGYEYNQALNYPNRNALSNENYDNLNRGAWGNFTNNVLKPVGNFFTPLVPDNVGEWGNLLAGIGSIYGAASSAKQNKQALKLAQKEYDEQAELRRKRKQEEDALATTINNVWDRQ